ncbi:hypothetical protein [Acidithiobacillus ferriphilus]
MLRKDLCETVGLFGLSLRGVDIGGEGFGRNDVLPQMQQRGNLFGDG